MSDCRGVLTAVEVAELFGVSEREVYGLCASGVLPHYICFDAAEIEGYLKKGASMTLRDVVKMRLRRKSKYGVVRLKNGGEWIIFRRRYTTLNMKILATGICL
jgi:hypothetical protein